MIYYLLFILITNKKEKKVFKTHSFFFFFFFFFSFFRIDDILLNASHFDGLESIPNNILKKGTKAAIMYLLEKYKETDSTQLYRTKVFVLGFEKVGKSSLLNCLFPLMEVVKIQGLLQKKNCFLKLEGKYLSRCTDESYEEVKEEYTLEEKQWTITDLNNSGLHLQSHAKSKNDLKIFFESDDRKRIWLERLRRVLGLLPPSGIYTQQYQVHPLILEKLKGISKLDLTIWDFSGGSDFYNYHHHFLSPRTIYLVVWRMDEGEDGLNRLDFWLKSLGIKFFSNKKVIERKGSNIPSYYTIQSGDLQISVLIIGTFLDDSKVLKKDFQNRRSKVFDLSTKNGFLETHIHYFEVSSDTLDNIDSLQRAVIFHALSHNYIGEIIPSPFVAIENALPSLREQYKDFPIVSIQKIIDYCNYHSSIEFNQELVKEGLRMVHGWGDCVYFEEPEVLSNIVVLDPNFLTKKKLSSFLQLRGGNQNHVTLGAIKHNEIDLFWQDYQHLIPILPFLFSLLQKFDVSIQLKTKKNIIATQSRKSSRKMSKSDRRGSDLSKVDRRTSETTKVDRRTSDLNKIDKRASEVSKVDRRTSETNKVNRRTSDLNNKTEPSQSLRKKSEKMEKIERNESETKIDQFYQQRSLIPHFLPEKEPNFENHWPKLQPLGTIQVERKFQFNKIIVELTSRLISKFHELIVDDIIWRYGALICIQDTLGLFKLDILRNTLQISIRGQNQKVCLGLINSISTHVSIICFKYLGSGFSLVIPSPYSPEVLLDFNDLIQDVKLPPNSRTLVCPQTKIPIHSEDILISLGILGASSEEENTQVIKKNVESFNFNESEKQKRFEIMTVIEDAFIQNRKIYVLLQSILGKMDISTSIVNKALAINNQELQNSFVNYFNQMSMHHKMDPQSFKKHDWIATSNKNQRINYLQFFGDYLSKFRNEEWNLQNSV